MPLTFQASQDEVARIVRRLHWISGRSRSLPAVLGAAPCSNSPVAPVERADLAGEVRHNRMMSLVEQMLELQERRQAAGLDHERELPQRQIDATNREIDARVHELYGLSDDEMRIVEGASPPQPCR